MNALHQSASTDVPTNSRQVYLLRGIPSLIVAPLLLILPTLSGKDAIAHRDRYFTIVSNAVQTGDWETADLFADKLAQLTYPGDDESRFCIALLDEYRGNTTQAYAIIHELAPITQSGFPPAHLWLARRQLDKALEDPHIPTEELLHHLICSAESPETADNARIMMARLKLSHNDYESADRILRQVAPDFGDRDLLLGLVLSQAGEITTAKQHLATVVASQAVKQSSLNPRQLADLATGLVAIGDFLRAEQIVNNHISLATAQDGPNAAGRFSATMTRICLQESNRLQATQPADPIDVTRAAILCARALLHSPANKEAATNFHAICSAHTAVLMQSVEMKGFSQSAASVDLTRGFVSLLSDDHRSAQRYFRQAAAKSPHIQEILTSLAHQIGFPNSSRLNTIALKLTEKATEDQN